MHQENTPNIVLTSNTLNTRELDMAAIVGFNSMEQTFPVVIIVDVFYFEPLVMLVKICVNGLSSAFIQKSHSETVETTSFLEMFQD